MAFNPDKFLAETKSTAPVSFDPDKFLNETKAEKTQSMGEQIGRKVLSTLPVIGAAAGGVVGAGAGLLTGPLAPFSSSVGAVAGAGVGGAGGEALKNLIEHYTFGDEKSSSDLITEPLKAGKDMAMYEAGGAALMAAPKVIYGGAKNAVDSASKYLTKKAGEGLEYTPIANKDAVEAAARNLNIEVPKGVLTNNPTYQKLESGLSQSGSIPARDIRKSYESMREGLSKAVNKISDMKTPDSDFALGGEIRKDLIEQVNKNKEPIKELYDNIVPNLQKIPVNNSVVNTVFGNLKKNPIFQTQSGKAFLDEHKGIISNTPELASLKEVRSSLRDLVNNNSLPVDANRVAELQKAVTSIRNNSIEALKTTLPKNAHPEVDSLISEISLADAAHASGVKDINSVKSILGNKPIGSPSTFVNKLSEAKESELAQKAINLDVTSMRNLKGKN